MADVLQRLPLFLCAALLLTGCRLGVPTDIASIESLPSDERAQSGREDPGDPAGDAPGAAALTPPPDTGDDQPLSHTGTNSVTTVIKPVATTANAQVLPDAIITGAEQPKDVIAELLKTTPAQLDRVNPGLGETIPRGRLLVIPLGVSVTLLESADNTNAEGAVVYRWSSNFALGQGQACEIVFWKPGQNPTRHSESPTPDSRRENEKNIRRTCRGTASSLANNRHANLKQGTMSLEAGPRSHLQSGERLAKNLVLP